MRARGLRDAELAVIDLEFTGLKVESDRVCEVALVRARGAEVLAERSWLVRPPVPMSRGAMACTGLSDALLSTAPRFADIASEVAEALRGAVLVAHNATLDLAFLQRELEEGGVRWQPDAVLDTLLLSRRLFAFARNDLGHVCRALGVDRQDAHRALPDARATYLALLRMVDILDPDSRLTVGELDDLIGALAPNSPLRLRQRKQLRQALRDRRTVWLEYQSSTDPVAGLVRREVAVWFLKEPRVQGWCHLRGAERVFRLDRIRSVAPGEREYQVPVGAVSRL